MLCPWWPEGTWLPRPQATSPHTLGGSQLGVLTNSTGPALCPSWHLAPAAAATGAVPVGTGRAQAAQSAGRVRKEPENLAKRPCFPPATSCSPGLGWGTVPLRRGCRDRGVTGRPGLSPAVPRQASPWERAAGQRKGWFQRAARGSRVAPLGTCPLTGGQEDGGGSGGFS